MNFCYKVIKIIYLYVPVKGKLYTLKITGGKGKGKMRNGKGKRRKVKGGRGKAKGAK
jgi:hypothetical protein